MKKIYIAGPMRGYERFNFDAFDAAEEVLKKHGWEVLNPAAMDRAEGFDPDTPPEQIDQVFLKDAMRRNLAAVMESDALALLPGWTSSILGLSEAYLAAGIGLPMFEFPTMKTAHLPVIGHLETLEGDPVQPPPPTAERDILEEALALTSGDRQATYGPPDQDFARTAGMWSALKGVHFEPVEVAMFMICLKLSRETHQQKRDNWVDMSGYSRCGWICRQAAANRAMAQKELTPGPSCETAG